MCYNFISNESGDQLKVAYINVNGICAKNFEKLQDIKQFLLLSRVQILGIGESKLSTEVDDAKLHIPNFTIIRKDFTRQRGGIMIYIQAEIYFRRRHDLENNVTESIWLEIFVGNKSFLVGCYYRNFSQTVLDFNTFLSNFSLTLQGANRENNPCLILGDFNVHNKEWNKYANTDCKGRAFKECCDQSCFSQLIEEHTYFTGLHSSLLDLILTNSRSSVISSNVEDFCLEKHCAISCMINIRILASQPISRKIFDFNKANFNDIGYYMNNELANLNFNSNDINLLCELITRVILEATLKFVPSYEIKINKSDKSWITNNIRLKVKHRNAMLRRYRRNKSELNLSLYKAARNEVVALNRKAKNEYLHKLNVELSQASGSKKWHKIVGKFINKGESSRFPPLLTDNGLIFDCKAKANLMNKHFCEITKIKSQSLQLPQVVLKTSAKLNNINITQDEVLHELKNLDTSKSVGPDGVSPFILKNCCYVLCPFITRLFEKIVSQGLYPQSWKIANVLPIFKSGDPGLPSNYRPISITSVLSKLLERIVHHQMYDYVMKYNLISPAQSGFIKSDSCTNRLMHFINSIYCMLESKKQVAVIFLDIKKAFDKVWHKGLVHKLREIGIGGSLLNLISTYLQQRRQRVVIDGFQSELTELFAGVPEGGVLSTLLFNIFINDITDCIQSSVSLFADDTSIYSDFDSINDPHILTLQNDLYRIEQWAKTWCIEFNPMKCKCMVFHKKNVGHISPVFNFLGTDIEIVNSYCYLGVTLDDKLTWSSHITNIVSKCNLMLNVMKQYKYYLSRHTLKVIYLSYVKSITDYADMLLSNLSLLQEHKLEQIQYHAMLTVTGCVFGTSQVNLQKELGWNTLKQFRTMHRLIFIYKVENNLVPLYLKNLLPMKKVNIEPNYDRNRLRVLNHRNPHPLDFIETSSSEFFNKRPIQVAIMEWNQLPGHLREINNLDIFKARLKSFYALNKVKYFDDGYRYTACVHAQLRLNVNSLNSSLYVRQLSASPLCSCGSEAETTKHYFLCCPRYELLRHQLYVEINHLFGNHYMHTSTASNKLSLLLNGDMSKSTNFNVNLCRIIQNYIVRTKRFKLTSGT